MSNKFTIGELSTPNPTLWLDLNTLDRDDQSYAIQTEAPGENWLYVNQFCSLLSTAWLRSSPPPSSSYGISDFSDTAIIAMAEELIALSSLDAQVAVAVQNLPGTYVARTTAITGISDTYDIGTKIWLGSDVHVYGIAITSETEYLLYDSNTGEATVRQRSGFNTFADTMGLTAFVVANV